MRQETTRCLSREEGEQEAVIEYCDLLGIPVVHIPNEGKRTVTGGARLKRAGMRPGFPDLFFPIARGGYHGLFIEMKRRAGGKVSDAQRGWIDRLNHAGYFAIVCAGADEAIQIIENYRRTSQ